MAQKATTLEQFGMLANQAADYTDEKVLQAEQQSNRYTDEQVQAAVAAIEQQSGYTYNQTTAAAEWRITHNLNRNPSVTVVDSAGNQVVGEVQYLSVNSLIVRFSGAFSGTAYLN